MGTAHRSGRATTPRIHRTRAGIPQRRVACRRQGGEVIRKRFFPLRGIKIVAWTFAGVAWVTAILAGRVAATPPQPTGTQPIAVEQSAPSSLVATVPSVPQSGLVIVRVGPAEITPPPTRIVRRVVQAPVRQTSKGS